MTPIIAFERLFFAVFGQTTSDDINPMPHIRPIWTESFFKIIFGTYLLVSVVVLINLLIAMMSDTYQRIQVLHFLHCIYYSPHESNCIIRTPVLCRVRSNYNRANTSRQKGLKSEPTWRHRVFIQNSIWDIYACIRSRSNKFVDCYDVWYISKNTGND